MEVKLLEHHFAQLSNTWNVSRNNVYSDKRKEEYHNKLAELYLKVDKEDFSTLSASGLLETSYIINFFFKSLEFLDKSTLNLFPFETVFVLNSALEGYIPKGEHIIVTSYVNELTGFSFDPTLSIWDSIYIIIKTNYNIDFNVRLIQINLSKSLARDYLSHTVLYHELGHFIEHKFDIVRALYFDILNDIKKGLISDPNHEVYTYFPYLIDPKLVDDFLSFTELYNGFAYHIAEYFCDIFAAQYIGKTISSYLDYMTNGSVDYSQTHPSTINRNNLVEQFIDGKGGYLLNKIVTAHDTITKNNMVIKFSSFESDDFLKLVPVDITTVGELHYIFIYGWQIWMGDWNHFKTMNNMSESLKSSKVYAIINNLIEKSIGNFVVLQEWQKK